MSAEETPIFILAGGYGTRLSEETQNKPKPMVEIGQLPILVHIMRWYYHHGFNNFVICAGYRSWEIKNYFLNYAFRSSHLDIDYRRSLDAAPVTYHSETQEKWRVRVIDTGVDTMTGARLARAFDLVSKEEKIKNFGLTYGDGVSDLNLRKEFEFHLQHKKIGTVLGVPLQARFGVLDIKDQTQVSGFLEKPEQKQDTVNGGFFFFQEAFRNYLSTEASTILERAPLERLAKDNQLMSFYHSGFWYPMDTLRDKNHLESLWKTGKAPWTPKEMENGFDPPIRATRSEQKDLSPG